MQAPYKLLADAVEEILRSWRYKDPKLCRLSTETHYIDKKKYIIYQGMSQSQYNHQSVMTKWELLSGSLHEYSMLCIEAINIKQIVASHFTHEVQQLSIVPLIASHYQTINIDTQKWQLTALTMPYFKWGSVNVYLKYHQTEFIQRVMIVVSLAETLATFHKIGWVHGDIKPSNFLIDCSPKNKKTTVCQYRTYLIDLSYAVRIEESSYSRRSEKKTTHGTPAYLAPECWQGYPMSQQSDIYAFGVLMYEILMGRKPYHIDNDTSDKAAAWATVHCQSPVPLLVFKLVNPKEAMISMNAMQRIVDKLLTKHVDNRYQVMDDVIYDLKHEVLNIK